MSLTRRRVSTSLGVLVTLVIASSAFAQPTRTVQVPECDGVIPLDPTGVTISMPLGGGNPADELPVREEIEGILPPDVTAAGATKSGLPASGLAPSGFIGTWLIGTGITNGGGAAPGIAAIQTDHLDDGAGINELDYEPEEGDEVVPLAGVVTGSSLNPNDLDGVMTVTRLSTDANGKIDLNLFGDQNNVMTYFWTYISVEADVTATFCAGSDDAIQILVDGIEVHINDVARGWGTGCQDIIPGILLEAGEHLITMKVFEGGGGHNGGLMIQDDLGNPAPGVIVVRDFDANSLDDVGTILEWNATRQQIADGLDYELDAPGGTIQFNGTVDDVQTGGEQSARICGDPVNPGTGQILEPMWLAVGPFTHTFGCVGDPVTTILGNHIAPSHIACVEPEEGDQLDYADVDAVTTGYTGPLGPDGLPIWRVPDDGNENGFIDLNVALGNADDVMGWLVTHVENVSGADLDVTLCFGSDDSGQIWVNDEMVHNIVVCRGSGGCQDRPVVTLTPGIHQIKMAAWDRGGGWNCNLAIQDAAGIPITPADGLLNWLGGNLPAEYEVPECPAAPQGGVRDLVCVKNEDGTVEIGWSVPKGNDPERSIFVEVNGEQVAEVPGDTLEITLTEDDFGDASDIQVCVQPDGALAPNCCTIFGGEELYVICGVSENFVDPLGRVWRADNLGAPIDFLTSPDARRADTAGAGVDITFDEFLVDNEIPQEIFLAERWNDGPIEYKIDGWNDAITYELTLVFLENCCSDGCLANAIDADPCDAVGFDGLPPDVDPQGVSGACRIFDIHMNDQLVQDQFSKSIQAACLAGVPAGPTAYGIAIAMSYEVDPVDGQIKILIEDLGGGNPPENASLKGFMIRESDGGRPRETNCNDGIDNDEDGSTDCEDRDCRNAANCTPETDCNDDIDNDEDGMTDCADPDCEGTVTCVPETNCGDDIDNDQDGMTDCDDPDCEGVDPCNIVPGVGFLRGDTDGNGQILLNDSIRIFAWLFQGGDEPSCVAAADASAQGQVNLTSGIYGLNFLFTGGGEPPAPFPTCAKSTLQSDLDQGCLEEHCP